MLREEIPYNVISLYFRCEGEPEDFIGIIKNLSANIKNEKLYERF